MGFIETERALHGRIFNLDLAGDGSAKYLNVEKIGPALIGHSSGTLLVAASVICESEPFCDFSRRKAWFDNDVILLSGEPGFIRSLCMANSKPYITDYPSKRDMLSRTFVGFLRHRF